MLVATLAFAGGPRVALGQAVSALRSVVDAEEPRWVEHHVIPGERLSEIAERYAVTPDDIVAANELRSQHPYLRVGRVLRVPARQVPKERRHVTHIVRFGDNWDRIGERYGVTRQQLRRWNPEVPRNFAAGQELQVFIDHAPPPPRPGGLPLDVDVEGLSLMPIPEGGESVGQPSRGRLLHAVQLPDNPALYAVRRPEFAYGSSHAVRALQLALAKFGQRHSYDRPLVISDMSRRRGGAYGSHNSHQSGRDVDIWLPTVPEVEAGTPAVSASEIDWDATWALVKALIQTGEVQYIFLSRARQRHLYRAAERDGFDRVTLGDVLQYPRSAQTAIVRHAARHDKHMHVRFRCAPSERRCR